MSRRIVVNREVDREVYLHNVLEDLLFGINVRFDKLTDDPTPKGWKSEAVNGLIIMAMLNEGWFNAIGEKIAPEWNNREGAEKRLKRICELLLSDFSFFDRPISSVDAVRAIRNEFAHSKPFLEKRRDEGIVIDEGDQSTFFKELAHPVEQIISIESYRQYRADSEAFRKSLLERSGLRPWDLRTKAQESSTFVKEADE